MTIIDFQVYKYELPLSQPLILKGESLTHRHGLIIEISAADGQKGYGEIAPLPGFSEESLEDAQSQTFKVRDFILHEESPDNFDVMDGKLTEWLKPLGLWDSVHFGLEMAFFSLFCNLKKQPLNHCLSGVFHDNIPINGLLQGSLDDIKKVTQIKLEAGYKALKLKVGGDVQESIQKVLAVNDVIHGKALLHVDANQSWTFEQALEFGEAIGPAAVDYIEEPFKNIEQAPQFFDKTFIPVAADESLAELGFEKIKSIEGVDFLILKPTILGGFERTWAVMQEAKRLGLNTVISSAFESDISILFFAEIAGCSFRNNAAGLDTLSWFDQSLLKNSLNVHKGQLNVTDRLIQTSEIDFSKLQIIQS